VSSVVILVIGFRHCGDRFLRHRNPMHLAMLARWLRATTKNGSRPHASQWDAHVRYDLVVPRIVYLYERFEGALRPDFFPYTVEWNACASVARLHFAWVFGLIYAAGSAFSRTLEAAFLRWFRMYRQGMELGPIEVYPAIYASNAQRKTRVYHCLLLPDWINFGCCTCHSMTHSSLGKNSASTL